MSVLSSGRVEGLVNDDAAAAGWRMSEPLWYTV